jgi:hypothetical protein
VRVLRRYWEPSGQAHEFIVAGSTPASAARQVDKRPVFTVSGMHSDARERVAATLRSLAAGSSIDLACHQSAFPPIPRLTSSNFVLMLSLLLYIAN